MNNLSLAKYKGMRRFLTVEESKRVDFVLDYLTNSVGGDLSEVDLNFLISVVEQYKKDGKLSDAQLVVVEKIWAKY